jgi:hypothetical protein
MAKAARAGAGTAGLGYFDEGFSTLEDIIVRAGKRTQYPYDVLGRQALNWIEAAQLSRAESRALLERVVQLLEQGIIAHPAEDRLQATLQRCKQAWLRTAVA